MDCMSKMDFQESTGITNSGTFPPDSPAKEHSRPPVLLVLELTSLFIIMISALVTNITAISTILRVRSLRQTPHTLLILNLSVGDLGVVFTSMPFSAVSSLDGGEFLRTHHSVCEFNGFCVILFSLVNYLTIVAIALDRVFIVTSTKILQNGRLRVCIMIVFLWLISIMVAILSITGILSTMVYVHYTRHCTYRDDGEEDEGFRIAMRVLICGFVLPLLTIFYTIIAYFLWKQKQKLRALQQPGRNLAQRGGEKSGTEGMKETSFPKATTITTPRLSVSDLPLADAATSSSGQTDTTFTPDIAEASPNDGPSSDQRSESGINVSSDDERQRNEIQEGRQEAPCSTDKDPGASRHAKSGRNKEIDSGCTVKRDKKNLDVQKRVALIGFLLVLSQIVCWGPFFLARAISADVSDSVGVFTMWSAYCVNFINPLIYAFMNRRARQELITYKNIIKEKLQCQRAPL